MPSSTVVEEITFQGTLQRSSVHIHHNEPDAGLTFSDLDARVRGLFNIPSTAQLTITYIDADNDAVTMANDEDYRDACILQRLNPLRLEAQVVGSIGELVEPSLPMLEIPMESLFKRISSRISAYFKQCDMLSNYKHGSPEPPPKRWFFFGRSERPPPILHHGVRCDSCGMTPIEGPRYKSLEKHDYDLCSSCMIKIIDGTIYHRIDTPMMMNEDQHHFCLESRMACDGMSHEVAEKTSSNLDSEFVQDLSLIHRSVVAPGTNLSHVWRMRNVGTLPWPQQTKLVPLGSGILSLDKHVNLELPETGLPCGSEIDISVDLTAPEKAGCYMGQWCLMAPRGKTFGHRFWVVIHVADQGEQSCDQLRDFFTEEADSKVEHVPKPAGPEVGSTDGQVVNLEEQKVAADGDKLSDFLVMEQYPVENATGRSNLDGCNAVELPRLEPVFEGASNEASQGIELGTCKYNYNTQILQNIDSNLQETIDNLVTSAGWDPMLKDLQQMGFHNMQLNRRILFKNNGSIKHAVRDLVDMEKQLPGSGDRASRRQLD